MHHNNHKNNNNNIAKINITYRSWRNILHSVHHEFSCIAHAIHSMKCNLISFPVRMKPVQLQLFSCILVYRWWRYHVRMCQPSRLPRVPKVHYAPEFNHCILYFMPSHVLLSKFIVHITSAHIFILAINIY